MRLTRQTVLTAALDLLDETGLEQLTMRRLAEALGVKNGATYWHFPSKQALLAAMADSMLTGLPDEVDHTLGWDAQLRALAARLRTRLLRRRDGARLFSAGFVPLPGSLAYGEFLVSILRGAGCDLKPSVWAADTITYYVVGHVAEEQLTAATGADHARDELAAALDSGASPTLSAAAEFMVPAEATEHFGYGLDLIIAGIARGLPAR